MSLCGVSLCWLLQFSYCYAECRYAECHYAEWLYADRRNFLIVMLNALMLIIVVLSVIMLNIVAPSTTVL